MNVPVHPGSEHLLVVPEAGTAEQIAEQLRDEGFADVRVAREAARTDRDDEGHQWAVYVRDPRLPDARGGGAYEGLRERFTALAHQHGGWYDAPGDPRPAE